MIPLIHNNVSKRFTIILLTIFSIALISSCRNGSSDETDLSNFIAFDKSALGVEVIDQDLGIKFFPPKNWDLQQSSISRKIESRGLSANPNDNFFYQPTYVFFDGTTGGFLSVGKVETNDTTLAKSARLNYYKGLLNNKYKKDELSLGSFIHSKINFTQLRFRKESLISFKIFFENANGNIVQFDYTVPAEQLEKSLTSIKSSLGSIQFIQNI